jgi:hypothetical protein
MKLTKEEYDALPASLKKMFTADGDNYVMKANDDDSALKRALEHEKEERKALKAERDRLVKEKEDAEHERNKGKGDVDSINASWQKKYDKLQADKDAVIAARENSLRQLLVTNKAQEISAELAVYPDLLLPWVEKRLQAEFGEDGKATTRVLDAEGKLSALSPDELKKDLLADKRFSGILKGSSASGGGASGGGSGGGASNLKNYKNADGTTNWVKVNQDMATNPQLLEQIKEFNSNPASTAADQ